jgi:hypothetical protein
MQAILARLLVIAVVAMVVIALVLTSLPRPVPA